MRFAIAIADPAILWGVAFAIFCLFGGVAVAIFNSARKRGRRPQLQQWAMQHGYEFRADRVAPNELAPMAYLTPGARMSRAYAENILRRAGVTAFDFTQFEKRAGESDDMAQATWVLFALDHPLPPFSFMAQSARSIPDQVLAMIRQQAGGNLFEIKDRPGFFVRAPNLQSVAPLFAGDRARFFDDKTGWQVEAEGRWLLIRAGRFGPPVKWFPIEFVKPEEYEQFLSVATSIRDYFVSAQALQ